MSALAAAFTSTFTTDLCPPSAAEKQQGHVAVAGARSAARLISSSTTRGVAVTSGGVEQADESVVVAVAAVVTGDVGIGAGVEQAGDQFDVSFLRRVVQRTKRMFAGEPAWVRGA